MFHDGFKTCVLEAFPGRFDGLRISVGADLHAIILVALRRNNERGDFFLLQTAREFHGIRFFGQRRHLQSVRANWNEPCVGTFR